MYFEAVDAKDNKRNMITAFKGYNHNPVIVQGELYDTKNLTVDRYPILSPRKKRSVNISLSEEETITKNFTITSNYCADITKAYATYKGSLTVSGETTGNISFDIDDDVIKSVEATFTFYDADAKKLGSDTYSVADDGVIYDFVTDKEVASVEVYVKAYPKNLVNFDEDEIDNYVNNFVLETKVEEVRGILIKDSKLCYMIGTTLFYNGNRVELETLISETTHTSKQTLISFGVYVLIFPLNIYYNTLTQEVDTLGKKFSKASASVTVSPCLSDGTVITATYSNTAPSNPTEGQYWYCTKTDSTGLNVYSAKNSMWQAVATTYLAITVDTPGKDFTTLFSVGDSVFMNTGFDDIDNGSVVQAVKTNSIVVLGLHEPITGTVANFYIERRIPSLDYVCVSKNRVWGCYKHNDINEIYASKLGDPKNWYCYEGISSDSYAISIGDDGDFTGCISYNGYPYFFKENVIYKIYGAYPSAYQLVTYNCRGVQKGCDKSLAVVGEYVMYKSNTDVCVFDGNSPTSVSSALGEYDFSQASAGSAGTKYYVSLHNDDLDEWGLFIYDIDKSMWIKEDNLRIEEFAYNNSSQLYGHNGLKVYGFEKAKETFGEDAAEETEVFWEAQTGLFGLDMPDKVYPCRFSLRADIPVKSELEISVSYDGGEFKSLKTARASSLTQLVSFVTSRCNQFRLKLAGHGDVKVYSLTYAYDTGSEEE